jgi:hypothetical protein
MADSGQESLERSLLVHLLAHRGHQVRFEADQWTTEFGILRAFADHDVQAVKALLRNLEMGHILYRRVQYVVGYTEPKLVYSLTPAGQRRATDIQRDGGRAPSLPLMAGTSLVPDFPGRPSDAPPSEPPLPGTRPRPPRTEGSQ